MWILLTRKVFYRSRGCPCFKLFQLSCLTCTKDFTVETSQLGTTDTGIWWRRCPCYHRLVVCLLPRLLIGSFSKTEPRFLEHLGLSCWRLSFLVLKAFAIFKVSFNSAIGLGASTASLSSLGFQLEERGHFLFLFLSLIQSGIFFLPPTHLLQF